MAGGKVRKPAGLRNVFEVREAAIGGGYVKEIWFACGC
jgi:hypothetical protein